MKSYHLVGAAAAALLVVGCGGGGGASPTASAPPPVAVSPPPPPPPPVSETEITVEGPIQGFGSIIVNGTRYDTDAATVVVDGEDSVLAELSVGQVVSLEATKTDDGALPVARRVLYEEALQGEVEAVDEDGFTILGIDVIVDEDTIFEDELTLETLSVGDAVEVSGRFRDDTELLASYVEMADDSDADYEIHGTVRPLDETAQTFRLRGRKIGYGSATLEDFEDGNVLSNGDIVEVEGSTFLNDLTLVATVVEYEGMAPTRGREAGDEAEIKGPITRFESLSDFDVAGLRVTTTADTEIEDCPAEGPGLGTVVEVEGEFDADRVLVADELECEREALIRARGAVDAVDAGAGTITVLGVDFITDDDTKFSDQGPNRVREFGLDDIAVGDRVEARGYDDDGSRVAKLIRRRSESRRGDELRGFVDSVGEDSLVIEGVTVLVDAGTDIELPPEFGLDIPPLSEAFAEGDYVKVKGTENADGGLVAERIEREDDEDDDEPPSEDDAG